MHWNSFLQRTSAGSKGRYHGGGFVGKLKKLQFQSPGYTDFLHGPRLNFLFLFYFILYFLKNNEKRLKMNEANEIKLWASGPQYVPILHT